MKRGYSPEDFVTVTYWAGRGRCEPLRVLLAAAGVEFKNVFLRKKEDMEALLKAGKLAYGQVPLVSIGAQHFVQTMPTLTYIARTHGLYPESAMDAFLVDQIVAACQDARVPLLRFPWSLNKKVVSQTFNFKRCELVIRQCRAPFF